ncbi:hypothetical protein B0T22DRAFT_462068 [Podospora appendiculata]|uniref:Uncharacterized protein n=1 Tax=Podospora appendiculata TaxID=314037 RepID=A0AAE0XBP9_9PEZI|nr:hypothetical protein B0T22DRAFT_462068 [Podospora appendiculata]
MKPKCAYSHSSPLSPVLLFQPLPPLPDTLLLMMLSIPVFLMIRPVSLGRPHYLDGVGQRRSEEGHNELWKRSRGYRWRPSCWPCAFLSRSSLSAQLTAPVLASSRLLCFVYRLNRSTLTSIMARLTTRDNGVHSMMALLCLIPFGPLDPSAGPGRHKGLVVGSVVSAEITHCSSRGLASVSVLVRRPSTSLGGPGLPSSQRSLAIFSTVVAMGWLCG